MDILDRPGGANSQDSSNSLLIFAYCWLDLFRNELYLDYLIRHSAAEDVFDSNVCKCTPCEK